MTQSVKNDMRATDRPFFLPINQFQILVCRDLGRVSNETEDEDNCNDGL